MPQFGDDIFLGQAFAPGPTVSGNPAPMERGVGPMGRVYIFDVVPATLDVDGLAVAQAVAAPGNLVLTAGPAVTATVDLSGVTRYVLDTPRCITIDSTGAGDTTQTALVRGYDVYGQAMSELIAFNGTTAVAGQKAFKSVVSIAISAALAGNGFAGFSDVLGLPVRVTNAGYIVSAKWDNTLADNAGTFAAADTTSPATTTTNDVRGTYLPSSAADGSKRLVMCIAVPALGCGPNATRIGAFGVDQA